MVFVPVFLVGVLVAVSQRARRSDPDGGAPDIPERLLEWTSELLPESRAEWGRAMRGELDHIEGRAPRWRFTLGCVRAAMLLPPQGWAGAPLWAMAALALGGLGVYAALIVRYSLGAGDWITIAIAAALVFGFLVGAVVLLRRPGVALPGMFAGVLVTLAWLAAAGGSFYGFTTSVTPAWQMGLLVLVLPAAVGVAGTLWGGSSDAGRHIARLAAVSTGLILFLYGIVAIAMIGGQRPDHALSVAFIVSDRSVDNVGTYLMFIPLATATIGWAAAAATGGVRLRLSKDGGAVATKPLGVPVTIVTVAAVIAFATLMIR